MSCEKIGKIEMKGIKALQYIMKYYLEER